MSSPPRPPSPHPPSAAASRTASARALLGNAPHRPPATLSFGPGAALRLARLHEGCGDARRSFAMMIAAQAGIGPRRPLVWIAPDWCPDRLNGDGMAGLIAPGHVLFVTPRRAEDVLWTLEEVLRAGVAPLAVADLPGLPSLTAVRRLHLAAETGAAEGAVRPLGLILTADDGGAPGVESRWHMAADHPPPAGRGLPELWRWRLERRRARTDPPRDWEVVRDRDVAFALRARVPAPA